MHLGPFANGDFNSARALEVYAVAGIVRHGGLSPQERIRVAIARIAFEVGGRHTPGFRAVPGYDPGQSACRRRIHDFLDGDEIEAFDDRRDRLQVLPVMQAEMLQVPACDTGGSARRQGRGKNLDSEGRDRTTGQATGHRTVCMAADL